jgi:glucan phosphoethanolaminetransferase (alkaline phosphatase superfamily)
MLHRLRPYAQLVRLPNVFTAFADIGLAALVVGALPERWPAFLLLLLASGSLYCAGMVWNDFFDIEQDRKERPFRPLPSGRVSLKAAARLGVVLVLTGLLAAFTAGWLVGPAWSATPLLLAAGLVAAILAYDGFFKRTGFGPLTMGSCRFLNVLLGLSLAPALIGPHAVYLALVVGVYIVGVTWFARTEARISNVTSLTLAAVVMLLGVLMALPLPVVLDQAGWHPVTSPLFPYLLVVFGFLVSVPVCRAIARPEPPVVQKAVKRAVLGLVVLDAVLATAAAGAFGLLLLLLLPPALFLGRRLYST